MTIPTPGPNPLHVLERCARPGQEQAALSQVQSLVEAALVLNGPDPWPLMALSNLREALQPFQGDTEK